MESEPYAYEEAEVLSQELAMRGCFYFKGFGMVLSDLLANLEIYAVAESTSQYADHVRFRLEQITALYRGIPFDSITDHPDYDLLVQIRDAVLSLGPHVETVLSGSKDIEATAAVIALVHRLGQEYRSRLTAIQSRLREQPGYEHAGLIAASIIDGKVWDSALG